MSEVITKNDLAKILSRIPLLKLPLTNLVDGSVAGSVRGVNTRQEDSEYTMGPDSVAIGKNTSATKDSAIAMGFQAQAKGVFSTVVGGFNCIANGAGSFVTGDTTIANGKCQTVIGQYNLEDTETDVTKQKALIIGNGTSDSVRSNGLTVDWDGNVEFAGKATGNNGTRDIELNISEATISAYVALGMIV